jgi:hypothetical protein
MLRAQNKQVSKKALQFETLASLKRQATKVNASYRKQIAAKKKECLDNSKRARQVLLIKLPKPSSGTLRQRKSTLHNKIKSRTNQTNVKDVL